MFTTTTQLVNTRKTKKMHIFQNSNSTRGSLDQTSGGKNASLRIIIV